MLSTFERTREDEGVDLRIESKFRSPLAVGGILELMIDLGFIEALSFFVSVAERLAERDLPMVGGCNETIFSGHTSFMVLILLYTIPYLHFFGKFIVIMYALFGTILIISLRSHYTIDVLLAWIITYLVYSIYMCCNIAKYVTK